MRRSAKGYCGGPQRVDPLRSDAKGWNKRVSSFVVVVAETVRETVKSISNAGTVT